MSFEVIPAIDIKDGRCVQLVGGVPDDVLVSLEDPLAVAEHWITSGADHLHIIDLDGAFGKPRNLKLIYKLAKLDAFIEVGGGIRAYEDVGFASGRRKQGDSGHRCCTRSDHCPQHES